MVIMVINCAVFAKEIIQVAGARSCMRTAPDQLSQSHGTIKIIQVINDHFSLETCWNPFWSFHSFGESPILRNPIKIDKNWTARIYNGVRIRGWPKCGCPPTLRQEAVWQVENPNVDISMPHLIGLVPGTASCGNNKVRSLMDIWCLLGLPETIAL